MYRITTKINDLVFDLNEVTGVDTLYAEGSTDGTEIYFDIFFRGYSIRLWFEKHKETVGKYAKKCSDALETRQRLLAKIAETKKGIKYL